MNETSLQIHSERHCYDGLSRPHPRDIVPRICNDRQGLDRGPETFFPIWLAAESQTNSNLRTRTPEERGPSSTTTPNYPNNSSPTVVLVLSLLSYDRSIPSSTTRFRLLRRCPTPLLLKLRKTTPFQVLVEVNSYPRCRGSATTRGSSV